MESLIDTRMIGKPRVFTGEEAHWQDWKFGFTNYMTLVDAEYDSLLDTVEA